MTPYYSDDAVTIYHGDCREVLPTIADAALAFADPPYAVGLDYDEHDDGPRGEPYESLIAWLHPEMMRVAPLVVVTPGIRNVWLWPTAKWIMAWHKPGSKRRSDLGGFNEWEPMLVYGKRRIISDAVRLPSVANLASHGETGDHPCPKPLRLMTWIVAGSTDEGALVVDPFMGSGTTLRASKDLGRKAVGIEISERYCEIAARRMAQEVLDFTA